MGGTMTPPASSPFSRRSRTVVQDVASTSIDEELDRLQEEADAFDSKQKPSTYARRLEEYQKLKQRAVLYRDALGVGADRASQVLDELEQKVSSMLELRKTITIHRDGTISNPAEGEAEVSSSEPVSGIVAGDPSHANHSGDVPPEEPLVTQGDTSRAPACLSFAGAQFRFQSETDEILTYVSDDAAAKSSVAALESMGIAGTWQQAGQVKVSIQNSGPEGAAVSLRFQVPTGQTLRSSATSLATWGIELTA